MQRIEITGGYVEIKDFINRKMAREYTEILSENARITPAGRESMTMKGINAASEFLVLAMLHRVVLNVVEGEGSVEKEITADREWLDSLDEQDFDKIADPVLAIMNKNKTEAKK